ncbi:MAG TPA: 6,7-dimethyl-8-ribityllumazine synthase [Pirellulales bacterium]|nr:6,7-dimethyl-8-ribityllumazine synthase [Pirellulales bacterium]
MMDVNVFEGKPVAPDKRIAIVISRYNETVTSRLLNGALATFDEHGVAASAIDFAWVPGAFEIPIVAAQMAQSQRYAAVLCLGAVIRGETTHDQHINTAVSNELASLGVRTGVPVLFGVLTCNSLEQALARAGGTVGNKGSECAMAALEMADLIRQMSVAHGRSTGEMR